MIKTLLFNCLIAIPCFCWSTQYQPWIGTLAQLEWRNSMRYQTYHQLFHGDKPIPYASDDLFLDSSLSVAILSFGLELEMVGANTRVQSGIDQLKITGKYAWTDDISGDFLTITTGLSLNQSIGRSIDDPSSFHHGRGEGELFLSIGKEFSTGDDWDWRIWGMGGIGAAADKGSGWLRGIIAYEKRFQMNHELKLFATTLYGMGGKKLNLHHFHAYGSIRHISVDLGLRYTYLIEFFGNASLEYSNRVYTRNFPAHVSQIMVEVLYDFGL